MTEHQHPESRATRALAWRAAEARRAALLAGATTLEEQARRLLDAGEIGPETAVSLGVEVSK